MTKDQIIIQASDPKNNSLTSMASRGPPDRLGGSSRAHDAHGEVKGKQTKFAPIASSPSRPELGGSTGISRI